MWHWWRQLYKVTETFSKKVSLEHILVGELQNNKAMDIQDISATTE